MVGALLALKVIAPAAAACNITSASPTGAGFLKRRKKMVAIKNTTITGTVAGAPLPPHALPNTVNPQSKALWVTPGTYVCKATLAAFIAAAGGNSGVVIVSFKGHNNPVGLRGLSAAIAAPGAITTRGNCLLACANGVTLTKAQASAKYAPAAAGKPAQKPGSRPSVASAWQAMLMGTYNPGKNPGPGHIMLVQKPL